MKSGSHKEFVEASNLVVEPVGTFLSATIGFEQATYSDQPVGSRGERVNLYIFSVGLHIG